MNRVVVIFQRTQCVRYREETLWVEAPSAEKMKNLGPNPCEEGQEDTLICKHHEGGLSRALEEGFHSRLQLQLVSS